MIRSFEFAAGRDRTDKESVSLPVPLVSVWSPVLPSAKILTSVLHLHASP
ncbi:MAG: hypothetical protein AAFU53_20265 [Cyanobacteria bacterium J06632_3]